MSEPLIGKAVVIGIGLIGSSIARAVRAKELVGELVVADQNADALAEAERLGLADGYQRDCLAAVAGADTVFLCTPIGAFADVAAAIGPHLAPGTVVTDVGSVKEAAIRQLDLLLPDGVHFVPGHPVAGTEQSGPAAGFADLFEGRWCILTPPAGSDPLAVDRIRRLWQALGSRVEVMDARHHDLVLAITSHVPHLIAYNIVGTASDLETVTRSEVIKYSAGGFRDFTRIAASDPTMWRDVFLNNKEAVLEMLGRFTEDLTALQRAIRWDDGDALFKLFSHTRDIRRSILDAGQDLDKVDFGRPHRK